MNYWLSKIVFTAIASVAILNVNSTFADDRFSVAIGSKDQLVIFSPTGEKVAEFNPPAIGQAVKVGSSSLQVSYGRDVNDLWTVIIAPSPSNPTPLSFTALDNRIDSDKSGVVTLTFSKDLKKVTIDPGYIGVVKVNDTRVSNAVAVNNVAPPAKVAPAASVAPRKEEAAPVAASATPTVDTVAPASAPANGTEPSLASLAPEPVQLLNPKKAYWSETVTPPNAGDLPAIASDEIKLLEVKGAVTVILPNTTQEVPATSGMTIPSGSTVKTGADGSAAAYLGGVNSARLMPKSEGSINQSVANNKRDTVIDLKNGVVFANVGRKAGETQDFKVKTPSGVAAAKGTAFVVSSQGTHLFIATFAGQVLATDANGNFIGTSAPSGPGKPGYTSNQNDGKTANDAALGAILVQVNNFNQKINAIEAKDPSARTPEEVAYLENAAKLAYDTAEEINQALLRMDGARGGPGEGAGAGGNGVGDPSLTPPAPPINTNPSSNVNPTTLT